MIFKKLSTYTNFTKKTDNGVNICKKKDIARQWYTSSWRSRINALANL